MAVSNAERARRAATSGVSAREPAPGRRAVAGHPTVRKASDRADRLTCNMDATLFDSFRRVFAAVTRCSPNSQVRKQGVLLEQDSRSAAFGGTFGPILPVENNSPGGQLLVRQCTEDGCLAGSRRSEQNRVGGTALECEVQPRFCNPLSNCFSMSAISSKEPHLPVESVNDGENHERYYQEDSGSCRRTENNLAPALDRRCRSTASGLPPECCRRPSALLRIHPMVCAKLKRTPVIIPPRTEE